MAMRKAAIRATQPYDFVIAADSADHGLCGRARVAERDPLNPFPHVGCTIAFNMSEQPAASINCGYSDEGLPIGLQIVGRRFDDLGVLGIATAFEAMRAHEARPWPEPPASEQPTAAALAGENVDDRFELQDRLSDSVPPRRDGIGAPDLNVHVRTVRRRPFHRPGRGSSTVTCCDPGIVSKYRTGLVAGKIPGTGRDGASDGTVLM